MATHVVKPSSSFLVRVPIARYGRSRTTVSRSMVSPRCSFNSVAKILLPLTAAVGCMGSAAAVASPHALVKLGSDSGALIFEPKVTSIKVGDTLDFVNNVGFPHNLVFDPDAVPAGVDASALSHADLFNAKGEVAAVKFETAGTYGFYCEPHQGAGMEGQVIVS